MGTMLLNLESTASCKIALRNRSIEIENKHNSIGGPKIWERIKEMDGHASNRTPEGTTFINEFVNAVYGILLGYGFCDSIGEIKKGAPEGVGPIFSSLAVAFTILVVCIYWWDWYKNIGRRAESNVREFALDIAILISLEILFFVYESPIAFSFVFLVLSVLSLAWVANYHLHLCRMSGYSKWS
jgi:hypothetical protein